MAVDIFGYSANMNAIMKLAKKYNLVVDYNMLKKDYYKTFSFQNKLDYIS